MAAVDTAKYWLEEIEDAKKRNDNFVKTGDKVLDIYACREDKKVPFNILYSNVDTLLPALYSSVPRPVVQRRFMDDDPLAKAACEAGKRMLEALLDTNMEGYETFTEGLQNAVIDGLLPGRGVTAVKYDAEITEEAVEGDDDTEPDTQSDGDEGEESERVEPETISSKEGELVCLDSKRWDRVLFGFSEKWSTTPWIAFEQHIDYGEAERLFGAEISAKLRFLKDDENPDSEDETKTNDLNQGQRKTVLIYQIWDKEGGKKLRYLCPNYKEELLKVEDDPLELTGFFPIPKPLMFLATTDNEPVAPYMFYETQAKELNDITRRINRITRAIKAKAIYDGELGSDLENLLNSDDNVFVPADKASAISAEKGLSNAIWFMPIEQLAAVKAQLEESQNRCKDIIYEITGISDIIRGSSVASETATAQNIKSQWGTMRISRLQKEVQRYARDLLRIMLEMASTRFSESTWAGMTNLKYATTEQVDQAQAILQAAQFQPQDPNNPNPTIQQAQQVLQSPQWPQVLDLLRNDLQRSYRIDIETNSTVLQQQQEDQQQMSEALAALGKYLQEVTPLVQSGCLPFQFAQSMMMTVVRRFEFGAEIEDFLQNMQPPTPPQPPQDNTLQVKQLELQAKQQADQVSQQADVMKTQASNQLEVQKMEAQRVIEQGRAATDMRIKEMEIESAERIARYQVDTDRATRLEIAMIQAKLENDRTTADLVDADAQRQHDALEIEKQRQADLYDAEQERKARAFEQSMNQPVEGNNG